MLSKNLISGKCYRDGIEIPAAEYADAVAETKSKSAWVNGICNGTATIDDAPEDWRMEISQCVAARQADDPDTTDEEATDEDYQAALAELGVSV